MRSNPRGAVYRQRWKKATNSDPDTTHLDKSEDAEVLSWLKGSHLSVGQLHAAKVGAVVHQKENRSPVSEFCDNPRSSGCIGSGKALVITNPSDSMSEPFKQRDLPAESESGSREIDALRRLVRAELECERLSGELVAMRGQLLQVEAENDDLRADLARAVERSHTAIDAAMEASQLVSGERELRRRRRRERDLQREALSSAASAETLSAEKAALEAELRDVQRSAQDARHQVHAVR